MCIAFCSYCQDTIETANDCVRLGDETFHTQCFNDYNRELDADLESDEDLEWENEREDFEDMVRDADRDFDEHGGYDDSMDGDHDSAMESIGWGTDEQYEHDTPYDCDY